MANQFFSPAGRGSSAPGSRGAGSTRLGIQRATQAGQVVEEGSLALQGSRDTARIESLIQGARQLKNIQNPQQKLSFLQNRKLDLERAGISTVDTDEAIQLLQSGDLAALEEVTDQAISLGIQPDQFTLSPGQTRFAGQREVASVAAAPAKQTSLQQNLIAAGLVPGSPEFQAAVLKGVTKPATQITIGAGKKEQEKLAELRVKQLGKFQEERDAAIDTNQSLDVLENIDVNTGALEPAKLALASFGKAFGLDTSGIANVAAGEGFNAEAKRLVLAVKASQKGPQTDKDEETIRATVANLGNTKAGNQFIINSARALNNRKIERADFFDTFLEDKDTLKGSNKAWASFKRNTPMVSAAQKTPEGLPVFFYKFDQDVRAANPDRSITNDEILELWRESEKIAKRAR